MSRSPVPATPAAQSSAPPGGSRGRAPRPRPQAASAPPITVFGAGHWLLAGDNVGPRVLDALGADVPADVEVRDVGTIGLDLLDHLRGQELAIVVDACHGLTDPGEVLVREVALETTPVRTASVHQIGPVDVLVIASHLYPERLPGRTLLVLVETAEPDEACGESAIRRAAAAVRTAIDEHRRRGGRVLPRTQRWKGGRTTCR